MAPQGARAARLEEGHPHRRQLKPVRRPGRPPARGGPTIDDGSTSDTNAAYYSRATPCGWPALVACSGGLLWWPAPVACSGGLLWRSALAGNGGWRATAGGLLRWPAAGGRLIGSASFFVL